MLNALHQLVTSNDAELDNALKSFDLGQGSNVDSTGAIRGSSTLGLSLFARPRVNANKGLQSTLFADNGLEQHGALFDGFDVES